MVILSEKLAFVVQFSNRIQHGCVATPIAIKLTPGFSICLG